MFKPSSSAGLRQHRGFRRRPHGHRRCDRRSQGGFTLLELLAVVATISAVAYAAVDTMQADSNQLHFEQTRSRMEQIRVAVIGDSARTWNGQPDIRGFATDVGRLPTNLRELLEPIDAGDDAITLWAEDGDSGVGFGWNGPYIRVFREQVSGVLAMRDAWGNGLAAGATNSFGWGQFADSDGDGNATGDLIVQSLGVDGIANPVTVVALNAQTVFEQDYPPSATPADPTAAPDPLVSASEYSVNITQIRIQFTNQTGGVFPTSGTDICVQIVYPDPDDGSLDNTVSQPITLNAIPSGGSSPVHVFTFGVDPIFTHGMRAIRVMEEDGGACDDADPDLTNSGGYRRFLFLPPTMTSDITWILQ